MDQTIFNIAVSAAAVFGGWVLKVIWEAIQDLKRSTTALASELSDVKVLVAGGYVSRDSFEAEVASRAIAAQAQAQAQSQALAASTTAIFNKLDRIEDKLDKKADKP